MKASLLKCAAVVAGVIFGSNGSLAEDNVWTYYAKDAENNPTNVACIVQGDWIVQVGYNTAKPGNLTLYAPLAGSGELDFRDIVIDGTKITNAMIQAMSYSNLKVNVTKFSINHFCGVAGASYSARDAQIFSGMWSNPPGNSTIKEIYFQSDTLTKYPQHFFCQCAALEKYTIDFPKLAEMTSNPCMVAGCAALEADVGDLIKPWYTSINGIMGLKNLYGSLVVTNLQQETIPRFAKTNISNVYIKGTCVTLAAGSGSTPGAFDGCTNLQSCVLDCPITNMPAWAFRNCSALTGDVMRIVKANTRFIGYQTFNWCSKLTGDLVLTNLEYIGDCSFEGCSKLGSVTLGSPTKESLKTGGWYGGSIYFPFAAEVKDYVLDFPSLTNATYFTLRGVTNLTICGSSENWTKEMIDYLIGNVAAVDSTEAKMKNCIIYCSKKQGWREKFASKFEGEEVDLDKPDGCFGVYVSETKGSTDGTRFITSVGRKAWLVHKAMPGDPTGLCIRVQ